MERRCQAYFAKGEIRTAADMHGMGLAACFARFASDFGRADDRSVIGFGNGFGIAIMVAVAVSDDDVLAVDVCRTDLGPGIFRNERIKQDSRHIIGKSECGMTVIIEFHSPLLLKDNQSFSVLFKLHFFHSSNQLLTCSCGREPQKVFFKVLRSSPSFSPNG